MPPAAPPRYSTQVICPYTSANQVGAMLWLGFILFLVVFPKVKYFYFEKKFPGKSRVSNCGDSCSGRRRSRNQKVLWGRNKLHSPLKRDIFAFSLYLHHTTKSDILIFAFFLQHLHQQNFFVLVSPIHLHFKATFLFLFSFHYSERCFPKRDPEIGCVQAIMTGVAGTWHTSDGNRDSAEFRADLLRITIIFTFWSKCSCTAFFSEVWARSRGPEPAFVTYRGSNWPFRCLDSGTKYLPRALP